MASIPTRTRKPCINAETFKQIAEGDIITYLLPAEMLPTNPLKEWQGRVKEVNAEGVLVCLLDEGYRNYTEMVRRTEIISVTKKAK